MLNQETKILIGIGLATLVILFGGIFFVSKNQANNPTGGQKVDANSQFLVRDNSHKIATDSAKVTLVEFADFQCPACGVAYPVIKKIKAEYAGKINYVFRHYPLTIHANAMNAGMAAEAASEQNKFWEMHDKLFETQSDWSNSDKPFEIFDNYAKDLGLDLDKFKKDSQDQKFADKIRGDQADGNALNITATPTLFVNGEQIVGVPRYEELKAKIDNLLK